MGATFRISFRFRCHFGARPNDFSMGASLHIVALSRGGMGAWVPRTHFHTCYACMGATFTVAPLLLCDERPVESDRPVHAWEQSHHGCHVSLYDFRAHAWMPIAPAAKLSWLCRVLDTELFSHLSSDIKP